MWVSYLGILLWTTNQLYADIHCDVYWEQQYQILWHA